MKASKQAIRNVMKLMGLTSIDGCAPGFFNILPLGNWADRCINFLTNAIRDVFDVQSVTFPLFFPSDHEDIKKLINQFDARGEVFHLRDDNLALSYSPDPNLLLWLSNKEIKSAQLPYAIETLSIFLRRTKSGGLNGIDRVRQFAFPGVFVLSSIIDAEKNVLLFLNQAAKIMDMVFARSWKLKITTHKAFYESHVEHFQTIEKTVGMKAEITIVDNQTRYFAYKLGLYADGSYADLMIFNLQWDNSNPKQFNIVLDSGEDLMIMHSTLAGAINRVYPALIGKGIANNLPIFPPLVAPYQIGIIYQENDMNKSLISSLIDVCKKKYFRYFIPDDINFNKKIASADNFWIPYLIIVPRDATTLEELKIFDRTNGKMQMSFTELQEYLTSLITTHSALVHHNPIRELPF